MPLTFSVVSLSLLGGWEDNEKRKRDGEVEVERKVGEWVEGGGKLLKQVGCWLLIQLTGIISSSISGITCT